VVYRLADDNVATNPLTINRSLTKSTTARLCWGNTLGTWVGILNTRVPVLAGPGEFRYSSRRTEAACNGMLIHHVDPVLRVQTSVCCGMGVPPMCLTRKATGETPVPQRDG
jgi:hypothetical protein